jgi:iron complex outermembrane recepter protein
MQSGESRFLSAPTSPIGEAGPLEFKPTVQTLHLLRIPPRRFALYIFGVFFGSLCVLSHAQKVGTRTFDLPADDAEKTLKAFSQQSGRGMVMATATVKGVRTSSVRGEFTAHDALNRMLAGTGLVATHDEKSGGFTVTRENEHSNAERPPQGPPDDASLDSKKKSTTETPTTSKPMKRTRVFANLASALALMATPPLIAQTGGTGTPPDEVVMLSVFQVSTDKDVGYTAANTLAGSRLNAALMDTPSPISVFNQQFLEDIAVTSVNEALEYGLNSINEYEQTGNLVSETNFQFRMRGISGAQRSRNFFRSDLNADSYNIERLDFARGPNSVLFGEGSPAGMINTTTKFAHIGQTKTIFQARIASFYNQRATLDVARSLGDKFAIRANLLWQDGDGYREFEFIKKKGLALAATWRPFSNTQIRFEGERIDSKENRARPWTAYDLYSFWASLGRPGAGTPTVWGTNINGVGRPGTGSTMVFHGGLLDGQALFTSGTATVHEFYRGSLGMSVIPGLNVPSNTLDFSVVPRNSNLYGPSSRSDSDALVGGVYLQQGIGRDLVVELAAAAENEDRLWVQPLGFARNEVLFDANAYLPQFNANGVQTGIVSNPHFGEQIIQGPHTATIRDTSRTTLRATATYNLQFEKIFKNSERLARLAGRHQLAVMLSSEQFDMLRINQREANVHANRIHPSYLNGQNTIARISYLNPFSSNIALRGARDPSLHPINDVAIAGNSNSAAAVAGRRVTSAMVNTNHRKDRTEMDTRMFVMQNYFWDGRLVGLFGWRHDELKAFASDPVIAAVTEERTGSIRRTSPDREGAGNTATRGGVFHVLPNRLSVYVNESDNFTQQPVNRVFGHIDTSPFVGNRTGEGRDAGLKLQLFQGRVFASGGWYKTADSNQYTSVDGNFRSRVNSIWNAINLVNPSIPITEVSGGDTMSLVSEGYELEITANPTRQLRLAFNVKNAKTETSNLLRNVGAYVDANRALWRQYQSAEATAVLTVGEQIDFVDALLNVQRAPEGRAPFQDRRTTANFTGNYSFDTGRLKGFALGGGLQHRGKALIGYRTFTDGGAVYAPAFTMVNSWASYRGRISNKVGYRIQLNVDNLLNFLDPQPVASGQPDPANTSLRMPELTNGVSYIFTLPLPRRYSLSATFTF